MVDESTIGNNVTEEIITATVFCVNTNCAYVYELSNHDIICEKKVILKA